MPPNITKRTGAGSGGECLVQVGFCPGEAFGSGVGAHGQSFGVDEAHAGQAQKAQHRFKVRHLRVVRGVALHAATG